MADPASGDDVAPAKPDPRSGHWLLIAIAVSVAAALISVTIWGTQMAAVGWVGDLFLDLLKMLVVPLIVASLITGVANLGSLGRLGRLGAATALYYFGTTLIAATVGIVLVNLIRPGDGMTLGGTAPTREVADAEDIAGMFVSDSLVKAMAELDVLPIIVFSIGFGIALTRVQRAQPVVNFFRIINDAMLVLVRGVMWLAPVGIFGLVAARFAESPDLWETLAALGLYTATVGAGLGLHGLVILPLLLAVLARQNPWRFALRLATPLLTAFSTASSIATLPLTMDAVKQHGISDRSAGFVLPVGATINMDGTALYEAVVAIFIAQAADIDLTVGQQILIAVTASLAAVGAAGIPEAGLVTLLIVLRAVDLPLEGIGLILALDWLLDRFRTAVNVWGDAVGSAVVDRVAVGDDDNSSISHPEAPFG